MHTHKEVHVRCIRVIMSWENAKWKRINFHWFYLAIVLWLEGHGGQARPWPCALSDPASVKPTQMSVFSSRHLIHHPSLAAVCAVCEAGCWCLCGVVVSPGGLAHSVCSLRAHMYSICVHIAMYIHVPVAR